MAERLKNILTFTDLAQGAAVVLPHGLHTSVGRPLAPDIIFVPSESLEVASDETNVTLTNLGPSVLSGSILVESWHTIERAFNDVNDEDLPVKPYIVVSPEGGNEPPQPPFEDVDVMIYARLNGSDTTGDGTLAKPYRTMQRAIRDVPSVVPAGTSYFVDITGIGVETLPDNYIFPYFTGAEGLGDFDFSKPFFHYYGRVNVQADPELVLDLSGATITPTNDATTNLIALQITPNPGWTADQFKGMFLIGATPTQSSIIWKNTNDTLYLTRRTQPTLPRIMQPSATLEANFIPSPAIHTTAVNIRNSLVSLLGLQVRTANGVGIGLTVAGDQAPVSFQLCQLPQAQFNTQDWSRVRQCYLPNFFAAMAPVLIQQSFFEGSNTFPGVPVTLWGSRHVECFLNEDVFKGMVTMQFIDLFEEFRAASLETMVMRYSLITDSISSVATGQAGAFIWSGAQCVLNHVKIDNATDPFGVNGGIANAITVKNGPGAWLQLKNVTGAGSTGFGLDVQDAGLVYVNDIPVPLPLGHDSPGPNTSITGALGDINLGDAGLIAWPAPGAPFNVNNPLTGAAGTNARVYGQVGP